MPRTVAPQKQEPPAMNEKTKSDEKVQKPSSYFDEPHEVVQDPSLSKIGKVEALDGQGHARLTADGRLTRARFAYVGMAVSMTSIAWPDWKSGKAVFTMRRFSGIGQIKRMAGAVVSAAVLWPCVLAAEPVAVRYTEGALHGFLVLRTLDDKLLAEGDLTQTVRGDQITARLVFQFKDGSVHEETTVYSQRQRFQLISDRLVQKGPTFPQPLDMSIDGTTGQVTVRYRDENGEHKSEAKLEVPSDLANGILPKLLMNAPSDTMPKTVSLIAAAPKPRLVKLAIAAAGLERFSIGGSPRQATHYIVKVEIGGIAGLLAPLLGLQPPDSHVWILGGEVPAFVRAEQPLYVGGPVWKIELASPVWPTTPTSPSAKAYNIKPRPPA
jgi:hypothetical protein